ncbi:EpsG family protein [Luteimonas qiangzhengi]|uniref:EpsG family protein n=1 Tax=Luteimonas sp. MJ146 TaxID=3129240 RepID=UPI0031BAF572
MFGYWFMFMLVAWAVVVPRRLLERDRLIAWSAVGVLFTLMIGLRHEVGGDWSSYLRHFEIASNMHLMEAMGRSDPGHYVVNWVVARLGGNIYWVNLLYGAVMMWGAVVFCRRQPWPWLALLVAVPYMLVVVGMGYSRQAVALGFALLGLVALSEHRTRMFVVMIVLGALFHKSAVLLLPIAALASSRNRLLTAGLVGATFLVMFYLLVSEDADHLWTHYVEYQRHSEGAKIRVLMNAIPAGLLLLRNKQLAPDPQERKLWTWIALFALLCLLMVSFATTAVDRVALYLIPIQLFVFSRVPKLAGSDVRLRTLLVLGVIAYYAAVLFVWLNFASHSDTWLPYQFVPFV